MITRSQGSVELPHNKTTEPRGFVVWLFTVILFTVVVLELDHRLKKIEKLLDNQAKIITSVRQNCYGGAYDYRGNKGK